MTAGTGESEGSDGPNSTGSDHLAQRARETPPTGIRRCFELAEEMDVLISLGVGEPDFSAP